LGVAKRILQKAGTRASCGSCKYTRSYCYFLKTCSHFSVSQFSSSDNYVIPLARKLEECRVFGVASDECLNYSLENRKEWAVTGQAIVEQMTLRIKEQDRPKWRNLGRRESAVVPQGVSLSKPGEDAPDPILKMEVFSSSLEQPSNGSNGIGTLLQQKISDSASSVSPTDEEEDTYSA
jgi:hypothetical protein